MEDNKLFSEFPPVSTAEWEAVIEKDLKGADYEKKLVWNTLEGFKVKPYYRAEDLEGLEYLDTNPNQQPYTRGKQAAGNVWDIRQNITETDPTKAGAIAVDAVKRGANSLGLCTKNVATVADMAALLDGLNLAEVKVNFRCSADYLATLQLFAQYATAKGYDLGRIEGSCEWDMYRHALRHGRFHRGEEGDYTEAKNLVEYAKSTLPQFRVLTIHGGYLHNAGSNTVQELGFALSAANDLVAHLTDLGLAATDVAAQVVLQFATGGNYFMEIAKLRAARLLWSKIVEQYNPTCECAYRVFIATESAVWNKSVYDPYVNMLRTTTETMSAAIGGADSIAVTPFDVAYKSTDDFGYRIARNQQLLLKEESYFDKIADPAAGSYYIENLTDSIAHYAWQQFLAVEGHGGFAKAIREGFVQDEVTRTATKRSSDIATRHTTILGTNQYPNLLETMGDKIEPHHCHCHTEPEGECEVRPLLPARGAEPFEALRLATERSGRRPKVFLLTYGNLTMRKARSGFATNFFGVAGYEIIDNPGFETVDDGVRAALDAKADIVVLCSSDDEYADITEAACRGLKGKVKSLVLAGFPKEMVETYRGYGIDEFIHVKTNVLESLTAFQKLFGIM